MQQEVTCIGGGPASLGMAWARAMPRGAIEAVAPALLSSPLTSARPFTFRFSAVLSKEESLSWD